MNKLVQKVMDRLVTKTHTHSAVIGCAEAGQVGLPVTELQIRSDWWQEIWAIWTRYFVLGPVDGIRIRIEGDPFPARPAPPATAGRR